MERLSLNNLSQDKLVNIIEDLQNRVELLETENTIIPKIISMLENIDIVKLDKYNKDTILDINELVEEYCYSSSL